MKIFQAGDATKNIVREFVAGDDDEDSTDAPENMDEIIGNGTDMPDIMDMMDMSMDNMDVDMETGTDMPEDMGMMDLAMENMQMVNDFTDALMNMIMDEDMETGTDLPVNL